MADQIIIDGPEAGASVTPIFGVVSGEFDPTLAMLPPPARAYVAATGFSGKAGELIAVPDAVGAIAAVLFGLGDKDAADNPALLAGRLATGLPAGIYRLEAGFADPRRALLAFGLGSYRFTRYRARSDQSVRLVAPVGVDAGEIRRTVNAVALARDIINTPANDMGPAELADVILRVAKDAGAVGSVTIGDELARSFPMVHAVGAAATAERAPRLIDVTWGDPAAPKVTLVGKGVVFDTGGLDIKSSDSMLLMKKDLGGAANALALAMMVMGAGLHLRLRLLVPAVENAIAGAAFRPGDVMRSRKGLTVEIGNTDAEGRLILGDALTLASEESPELLFDFATLTGAARVALGPDIPAIFSNSDALAADLARHAVAEADPLWRLPLWAPYAAMIDSKIADINNAGQGGFAGAITAALFLKRFVGDGIPWVHTDLYAWSRTSAPGRPEGGDAQTIRAIYALLKERYPAQ